MRAAVFRGVGTPLTVEDVQTDSPGPHEVLIQTGATGVCRSDLHYVNGSRNIDTPAVLGHEASGTVEVIGSRVSYVRPGDKVITCLSVFCGRCEMCVTGRPALCSRAGVERDTSEPSRLYQGGSRLTQLLNISSFAEQMLVHENSVIKVDDDLPFEQLALIGCGVTTGIGAVINTAQVEVGSSVAVVGCGGVGLNCVQGAVLAGASQVIAIDQVDVKLAMAREFGATDVLDSSSVENIVETVRDLTGGGVDYSFEAIGSKTTAELAFTILAPAGTATLIGLFPEDTRLGLEAELFLSERKIQGCSMGSNRFRLDMPRYIELYRQGRLKLDELVSRRLKLDQLDNAFDEMRRAQIARSVVVFDR